MPNEFLKDEKFLRIRKLNAEDGAAKRKSVVLSDNEYDDDSFLNLVEEVKLAESSATAVASGSEISDKILPSELTSDDVAIEDEEEDEDGIELKKLSKQISRAQSPGTEERIIQSHVKHLHGKEKLRYRRDSKEFVSYFNDVKFEERPSILDGSINVPYQESFNGPTLEKIMKQREKEKLSNNGVVQQSSFAGIYVLFWMALSFSAMRTFIDYYNQNNGVTQSEILNFMTSDLFTIALVDFCMYLGIWVIFAIQWLCRYKFIQWRKFGWNFTAYYEPVYVIFFIILTENILHLHWIAKIFLFLHSLVLLMKMHSFAFFNGYLWDVKEELEYSENALSRYKGTDKEVTDVLKKSISFCKTELASSSNKSQKFPKNINVQNYFMYTMFPTLVYQTEYPRTNKIRWRYVAEKLIATFGIIFVMMVVAQTFMYPIAMRAIAVRHSEWTGYLGRLKQWMMLLIDIVPGFIVMYMLNFYLIWDAILNGIAELTCFADRYFYGDWWNCVDWSDFSRIWNIPVHKFLLRHVYHSSISCLKLTKSQATFMTFFISSVIHELAMYVIFNKLRFYLFFLQMCQLPLVAMSKTKFLRDRPVIGNVIFWIGICTGPSIMCTLYLTF
ncbi:hypothetical protein Kpol_1027p14 [Vanderwaltozyma polyspora DSM 70294]|uniref:O-acyltransferase n=1 Tax=Vanderwaltozyma polyspora (strain ATCC 22028 / DSM 70294 / BCRC 21397 / CBS 2163 / NBRC 10782 / NRRL Y-8283 / UCD 57-17) TaxID=436907 RepID=A7TQL9_VANPO|nr:uncharacterized protein Kpol_1027p14 [Vanderwaltozyma polyspora DSM 70294]EDO15440.1 hypothetical protein Kpol_1027p14 [Vanderwaltozyma polyspora DSM 70294]